MRWGFFKNNEPVEKPIYEPMIREVRNISRAALVIGGCRIEPGSTGSVDIAPNTVGAFMLKNKLLELTGNNPVSEDKTIYNCPLCSDSFFYAAELLEHLCMHHTQEILSTITTCSLSITEQLGD